jgi:hypothetical protein
MLAFTLLALANFVNYFQALNAAISNVEGNLTLLAPNMGGTFTFPESPVSQALSLRDIPDLPFFTLILLTLII